ncbi:hypothetical protein U1Q18_035389 [Sarracenia purpurea var. burkii]
MFRARKGMGDVRSRKQRKEWPVIRSLWRWTHFVCQKGETLTSIRTINRQQSRRLRRIWLIGSVLIVCGLYVVLWGKGREMKRICELLPSQSIRGSGRADISARQSSFHSNCSNPLGVIPNGVPFVFSDDLSREVSEPSDRGDEDDDDEDKDFEDEDKHEGKEGSS